MAASTDGNVSSTCASVSSPPVHPMSGSMNGAERRSRRSFHLRVLAPPDVIADRAGR
jgi:hypothetical protein